MAEGIPSPNVVLKIGFLNRNTQENFMKYKVDAEGKSLGELHMAEGIPNPIVILKIGFLNRNTQENRIKYKVGADG
jgi:hypothetical protein